MPSTLENGETVILSRYDVVAEGDTARFIRHTGLANDAGEHDRNAVKVTDMGPPLRPASSMKAYAIGKIKLDEGESRKIKDFIDRYEGEHRAISRVTRQNISQIYTILPHANPYRENDRRYVRMRFSCAGFVFEAYRRSRLLLTDHNNLPVITIQQVKEAYPDYASLLDHQKFRESMGLMGNGPWPILLCGYLINSLNRDEPTVRSGPALTEPGDELFPKA